MHTDTSGTAVVTERLLSHLPISLSIFADQGARQGETGCEFRENSLWFQCAALAAEPLSGPFVARPERSRNAKATPTSVSAAVIVISWSRAAANTCSDVCWYTAYIPTIFPDA